MGAMRVTLKKLTTRLSLIFFFLTLVSLSNCSTFFGGSTSSTGDQSIVADVPTEVSFSADVNTKSYKTITFTNRSAENYEIYNLALVDNLCGAFSIYNILDESGNILYQAGDAVSISVAASQTVNINIQFAPVSCEKTAYTTIFFIYYSTDTVTSKSAEVNFVTTVNDTTPETMACPEQEEKTYYDEYDNPTERTLPVLTTGTPYYLKVEKVSAYIQTTGEFSIYETAVGTNINTQYIAEEDLYVPAYIPLTTDDAGVVTIPLVDECAGFDFPSPITDQFFIGAQITVTTTEDFTGTIGRGTDDAGTLLLPDFQLRLYSYINNSNSLLQSSDGIFQVKLQIDLTTGSTEANNYLTYLMGEVDDDGEPLLSISGDQLVGKSIRHGTVTLVGIGSFLPEDAIMSAEGYTGIIENEAYLFLQLVGLVTQEVGS